MQQFHDQTMTLAKFLAIIQNVSNTAMTMILSNFNGKSQNTGQTKELWVSPEKPSLTLNGFY